MTRNMTHDAAEANATTRRRRGRTSLLAKGEPMIWLTGGALIICLAMIVGLLSLIAIQGFSTFWPGSVVRIATEDERIWMGEITRTEEYERAKDEAAGDGEGSELTVRRLMRTGNFDLTNTHFNWIDNDAVVREDRPRWAILAERRAWGRFYGMPTAFIIDGDTTATSADAVWAAFERHHSEVSGRYEEIFALQKYDAGEVHARLERARLELRGVEQSEGRDSGVYRRKAEEFEVISARLEGEQEALSKRIRALREENARYHIQLTTASGQVAALELSDIVRALPANQLGFGDKISVYLSRWWEFLTDDPREANSEGGVWPAIVGTVIMTLLMSIAVVPFGVLAALYLREYAKEGPLVSTVRIAVNNLAGVPSIVFGVFGLGFFCYILGASLDQLLFAERLPNPTYGKGGVLWASLTLALLTLPVVIVATEESLAAVPSSMRHGSYACGASKWQTIRRIVLPRAMPGIMTGLILAMARGAGEVAPLMLVGAVKLAPDLPIDGIAPYLHPERSFMHLGFHIYDVGFQSQNSEAAKPMVFTTTLLLITIIAALNIAAVRIRTQLRKKFVSGQF